jgi:hypothetical protein
MRIVKGALIALGVICITSCILLGVGFYVITQPPLMEAEMAIVIPNAVDAQAFDSKVEDFSHAVGRASSGDVVHLVLTQEEATSKLVELLKWAALDTKVQELCINFRGGKVLVLAKLDVGTLVSVGVVGAIKIDDRGKPKIIMEKLDVGGGAALPAGVSEQALGLIANKDILTDYIASLAVRVSYVVVDDGQLIIWATVESPSEIPGLEELRTT